MRITFSSRARLIVAGAVIAAVVGSAWVSYIYTARSLAEAAGSLAHASDEEKILEALPGIRTFLVISSSALAGLFTFLSALALDRELRPINRTVQMLRKVPSGEAPRAIPSLSSGPEIGDTTRALQVSRDANNGIRHEVNRRLEAEESERRTLDKLNDVCEQLRETYHLSRIILESSLHSIIAVDSGGRITEFNAAAEKAFRLPREEAVNRSAVDLIIAPESRQRYRRAFKAFRKHGRHRLLGRVIKDLALRSDGVLFPIELAAVKTTSGQTCLTMFLRDISEEQATFDALRESEERFQLAVRGSTDGIWDWEIAQKKIYLSPRFLNLLGYDESNQLEETSFWDEQLHPDDREPAMKARRQHLTSREPFNIECRLVCRDSEYRWFQLRGQAVWDHEGWATRMTGSITDISARMAALAEVQSAREEAEASARARDDFLASMSHELRTPLSAVLGLSEAMLEETYGPLRTEQQGALRSIESSGRHLLALINDILDMAKAEAGKLQVEMRPTHVETVCKAALDLVKQQAAQKNLQTSLVIAPAVRYANADERRLKQILVNLLSNAVKFTPDDGEIGLIVDSDAVRRELVFCVWDRGIGISAKDRHRLFEPFAQLDSGLTRRYEGSGLGLALVYKMAQAHGATVTVKSKLGEGSRFFVRLPWEPHAEPASTPSSEEADREPTALPRSFETPDLHRLVLLAEDNELNAKVIAEYLEGHGHEVVVASNGETCVQQAIELKPEVILMDVHMPFLDGLEATRRLRREPSTSKIPILGLTALVMPGDRENCLAAGMDEYLQKPVSLARLQKRVAALCAKSA